MYCNKTYRFLNWEIPITDINHQIQIENLFKSTRDNGAKLLIELSHQLDLLVKRLRQQLLQDAVQGKLVEQDANDEPASELLKKIKAEKEKLIAEKKLKKDKPLPPIKPEEIPFDIPGIGCGADWGKLQVLDVDRLEVL